MLRSSCTMTHINIATHYERIQALNWPSSSALDAVRHITSEYKRWTDRAAALWTPYESAASARARDEPSSWRTCSRRFPGPRWPPTVAPWPRAQLARARPTAVWRHARGWRGRRVTVSGCWAVLVFQVGVYRPRWSRKSTQAAVVTDTFTGTSNHTKPIAIENG